VTKTETKIKLSTKSHLTCQLLSMFVVPLCASAGRTLTEREKVSAQIISNWFANKRKELKKLAREGLYFLQ